MKLPDNPTAADLREAAQSLNLVLHPLKDPRKSLQADLFERVLKELPADERSKDDLRALVNLCLERGETDRATTDLNTFGTKAGLSSWEAEGLRAAIAACKKDWGAARACYQRVADDPEAPEWRRVGGEFWAAYSTGEQGDRALARSLFQGIVDRYGPRNDPLLRDSVEGARSQIRLLDAIRK